MACLNGSIRTEQMAMNTAALERTGMGLDFVQALVAGETANVPMGDTLGFRVTEAGHGRAVVRGRPDARSYNLIGTVHGGWAATVLDTVLALSVFSTLDDRHDFTTVDIKINFLRPITAATGEVRAEGRVVHGGRRIVLSEAQLTDPQGKLLAYGSGTCLIIPR